MNKFKQGDEVYLTVGSCDMVVTFVQGDSVFLAWMEGNDGPIHNAELPYWVLAPTTKQAPTRPAHPSTLDRLRRGDFNHDPDDDIPF